MNNTLCTYGVKCYRPFCSFIHPNGREIDIKQNNLNIPNLNNNYSQNNNISQRIKNDNFKQNDLKHENIKNKNKHDQNNSNNNNIKLKNKNKNTRRIKNEDFEKHLYGLTGKISMGEIMSRISIRIMCPVTFGYENSQWKPYIHTNKTKLNIFYKENEKVKPVVFYFENDEKIMNKINNILEILTKSDKYLINDNNKMPYTWFYNGHIFNTYKDIDLLFKESLTEGNLKLFKANYNDKNEHYKFKKIINDKEFSCQYLFNDYQIINKNLNYKKTQSEKNDDDNLCLVCYENDKTTILLPCGHFHFCLECSNKMDVCAVCRTPIQNRNLVYQ